MCALSFLFNDLNYWVKPKSTTWFSRFLLIEFDEDDSRSKISKC
jgi:hypothetical protein